MVVNCFAKLLCGTWGTKEREIKACRPRCLKVLGAKDLREYMKREILADG